MPAVKVFSIFGGQKPAEKQPTPPAHGAIQKLYRTFSVSPEISTEHKLGKVTAIAACIEKKITEPSISKSDVQNILKKTNTCDSSNSTDCSKLQSNVYENVNIVNSEKLSSVSNNLLEETKGYSSIYENITFIGKIDCSETVIEPLTSESKLGKALESFDKILTEFSSSLFLTHNPNFVVPKLQKSKTCSIIESRCILKKTNSDPETERRTRHLVSRNNSIDKTTSLWNLDDMRGKELTSPLTPLNPLPIDKMSSDKYATYKVSSKPTTRATTIKTEDLKKLDVKTRILKKTLSNPPSTPVPVVSKTKPIPKKLDKKFTDIKKDKPRSGLNNARNTIDMPKSQMQKAKSVWEIGNESMISPGLERTKSSTSIAGSPSKIPVIRSQMSQNKFSTTRALFSPTPVDLTNVDQPRECAQKKKPILSRKTAEKIDQMKQTRQKSQLNLKADSKRQSDKAKKDSSEKKVASPSPKSTLRDYSDELNAVRAKIQVKKINNKRDLTVEMPGNNRNQNDTDEIDSMLSPVKYLVKKLEFKTALELKTETAQFTNCKVIPPFHKEVCVANTTFHNHLSTLVGRQIKCIESRDDIKTYSQQDKLTLHKHSEEKISDTHSDCSDDSGHVSNDAANDNDAVFDNVLEMSRANSSADELGCKLFDAPKQFRVELPENAKNVCPVRPARRGERCNEVASGIRAIADTPKVDEQVRHLTYR